MEQEINIDLLDFWNIVKKRLNLIIIITLSATIISGIVSFYVIKPTYEAKVSVVIGKTGSDSRDKSQYNYNDVIMYQNLVKTYTEIAKSRVVAEKTSEKLNNEITVEDIQKLVTVTPQANTQILMLKAESKNPNQAMNLINFLTESFEQETKRIFPDGEIKIMDKAQLPNKPVKPNKKLNVAIAFFIGLMLSFGLVFILEFMDRTIKTENDVEKYLGLPVIGIIPKNLEQ